jgi:hypothetical protein
LPIVYSTQHHRGRLSKILTKENKFFYEPKKGGKKRFSFTLQEAWLPRLLIVLFVLYAAAMIVSVALGWL